MFNIPLGTDMTPYYIGVGLVIWIIGLISSARTPKMTQTNFVFVGFIWTVLCIFWPVLIVYAIVGGIFVVIWKIFGAKS